MKRPSYRNRINYHPSLYSNRNKSIKNEKKCPFYITIIKKIVSICHFVHSKVKNCHQTRYGTVYAYRKRELKFINHKIYTLMKPINDRVVIKPARAEEKTKGGIIIPDTAKEKPLKGEVIAVGPGKDGNLMTVQAGDIVLYGKYAGQEMNYEGEDYLIMREDDILVVL